MKTARPGKHETMGVSIPARVLAYFRMRGSRSKRIWPHELRAFSRGWVQVGWASPRMQRKHGPTIEGKAWPIDTEMVQWTDGDIFADFTRRELMESGVAK